MPNLGFKVSRVYPPWGGGVPAVLRELSGFWGRIKGIKEKEGKTQSFLIKSPPQAENFEDFRGVFGQKTRPKCTQEGVFDTKTLPKCLKIFRLRRAYYYKIRLNAPNVFFSRLRRPKS